MFYTEGELSRCALLASVKGDSHSLRNLVERGDFLANPDWQHVYGWSDIEKGLPRVANSERGAVRGLDDWWSGGREEQFEAVWPARTKTDLAIRRTRARDLWLHSRRTNTVAVLKLALGKLRGNFDYISVLNLGWAYYVMGSEWWWRMLKYGAFDDGVEHYVKVCKYLNDFIKTKPFLKPERFLYVECATFVGYRNPPYPGFDVEVEAQKLAAGGEVHSYPAGWSFESLAEEALAMSPVAVPFVGFDDYIKQCQWLTTGSSSIGYLHFSTPDGDEHKIKCRKNFVPDVVELDALIAACRTHRGQQNRTIIKSELGKIRLAVAADLENYLMMTWINHLIGGAYKQWAGSTIEETVSEQVERMIRMLELCSKCYGLPFDYAAFDHQPTTEELKVIVRMLIRVARHNVPPEHFHDFDLISKSVLDSFDDSTLTVRTDNGDKEYRVTGGLMSGLRWTSVVGNGWNSVMTFAVVKMLAQCGINTTDIERYIRGDDSAIFTSDPFRAMLIADGYKRLNVLGGVGKFSVRKNEMEFLRVWYTQHRVYGYPARAAPGLVQRKPWSNAPWEEAMVPKALQEVCRTLTRRGCDVDEVWNTLAGNWCSLHSLPRAALSVPIALGGFGIEAWDGRTRLTRPIPRVEKPPITITNQTPWRANKLRELGESEGIVLTPEQYAKIAAKQLANVVASDDVPSVGRAFRQAWKQEIKKVKIRAFRGLDIQRPVVYEPFPKLDCRPGSFEAANRWLSDRCGTFGKYSSDVAILSSVKDLLRESGESIRSWIRRTRYGLDVALKKSKGHIGEALDWLGGLTPVPLRELHPQLTKLVSKYLASILLRSRQRQAATSVYFSLLAPAAEKACVNTDLAQKLFLW